MPRPNKSKRIGRLPSYTKFEPVLDNIVSESQIVLSLEEYEVIRLMDYLGLNQATCALQMNISRATVQAIYTDARKKLARFLMEGLSLCIAGGNIKVGSDLETKNQKGSFIMKIAVTYENGTIFQHFGHTGQFKIYTAEDGKILSSEIIDTNGSGHGALATFLKEHQVSVLICGGIGGGAKNALSNVGIEVFAGAVGNADAQVQSFLAGTLSYQPDASCAGHKDKEGHCEHHCGENSCEKQV